MEWILKILTLAFACGTRPFRNSTLFFRTDPFLEITFTIH